MNLPIDVVVELLMLNVNYRDDDDCVDVCLGVDPLVVRTEESLSELRNKVREHLLTLVPKPKKLSECEEYKNVTTQGETIVYRVGKDVYRSVDNTWVGYADQVRVIQPEEVK